MGQKAPQNLSPSPSPSPSQQPQPQDPSQAVKVVTVTVTRRHLPTPHLVKRALLLGDDGKPTEYASATVVRRNRF